MNFTTKQIFHIFLFTILTAFLLPITVSANSSSTRNFRTVSYSSSEPIYPKKDETVTLKNNKVIYGQCSLTSLGKYDPNKFDIRDQNQIDNLKNLAKNLATEYGISADRFEIYKLKISANPNINDYGFIVAETTYGILFQGTNSFYLTNERLSNNSVVSYTVTNDIATIYEAKEFVSFNLNGSDAQIDTQIVDKNGKATQPKDPTRNGYIFMGWYTDKECLTKFDFNTPITADITLYAKWVKNNEEKSNFTYAYYSSRDPKYPKNGDTVTLDNIKTDNPLPPADKMYILTSLGRYDSNKTYTGEENLAQTIKSTAKKLASEYGTVSDKFEIYKLRSTDSSTINYGFILAKTTYGILFQGTVNFYLTDQNLTWNGPITYNTIVISDIATLSESRKAVNFDLNGANRLIVNKNEKVAQPTNITRDGYKFMGWYTDAEGTTKFDFNTPITTDITLYAKWEKIDEDNIGGENKNTSNGPTKLTYRPSSKSTDIDSTELTDKQDNKNIDNDLTKLTNKQDNKSIDNNSTELKENASTYNPNTGDNSNTILYIFLMSISNITFVVMIIYRKKHSIR